MSEYDAYDFQNVPDTYDSYDFQGGAPAQQHQYDSYDLQGSPEKSDYDSYDLQGSSARDQLSPLEAQDNYGYKVPNVDADGKAPGFNSSAYRQTAAPSMASAPSKATEPEGAISQIMKGLGLNGDLSNPKTVEQWMKVLAGGGGLLHSLLQRGKSENSRTPRELAASLPGSQYSQFNPQQQQWANNYFNTPMTPWQQRATAPASGAPSSLVAGRRYAQGGEISGMPQDPGMMQDLGMMQDPGATQESGMMQDSGAMQDPQGPVSLVKGEGGGQDDMVDAKLSPGEYVFDADVVSAVGDGDNAAGASILDKPPACCTLGM